MSFRGEDGFRSRKQHVTLDMTPLIDCIFQLLVFFMLTSTFASKNAMSPSELGVTLPKSSKAISDAAESTLRVVVDKDGSVTIDNQTVAKDALLPRLQSHLQDNAGAKLNIYADQAAIHGRVVEIMDMAKSVGFQKLGVATTGH